ncbi:hypothetical protein DBO86_13550 [Pseudomonas indoloxydans]|uniref:Glycosyl transferase family 1 n=1 Tax=Ectopseudomonas oleovorans TaxID=301 RepID=A0A2T5PLE3_ECTOL|nr:glycosyltransferase [Pseudomonas indoloxydans]PTU78578.1 hypothetical protein DBO86_13550 [Pseudomonas indoloxydans]
MNEQSFYRAFAERFQGAPELVTKLHEAYLPFMNGLAGNYPAGRAIDLGCGRGQWLSLTKGLGFRVIGVDLDDGMLSACHEQGLPVEKAEAVDYLKRQPDDSAVLITAFHVVEHMAVDGVVELLREALRVLSPGGLVILETPNPENIWVSTNNFHLDPTHVRPLPPEFLRFLSEYSGFSKAKVLFPHSDFVFQRSDVPSLRDVLFGVSMNYAVVCQKPSLDKDSWIMNSAFLAETGMGLLEVTQKFDDQIFSLVKELEASKRELISVYSSSSWLMTRPLRILAWALKNPSEFKLKVQQRAALKERASSWKRKAMTRIGNLRPDGVLFKILRPLGYERINFGAVSVFFSRVALEDNRGIGRVSRELFQGLQKLSGSGQEQVGTVQGSKDVYFYSSIHWCPDVLPARSVVMIHDVIPLIFEEHYPDAYLWKGKYKTIAQQADLVVTISESSADDISKYLEISRDKIRVVYNGVTQLPVAASVDFELPVVPFVTYLGAYDWHKNLSVVLKAMQLQEGFDLVIIGDNHNCRAEVEQLGISERVRFLGRLDDAEVGYVLSKSLALVFPSRYEGFGLPPLEAALIGAPSICSHRPAMTELLYEGAIFVDPDNAQAWGEAICGLIKDDAVRGKVSLKAKEIAQGYTWDGSLLALVGAFEKV